jgi:hypothetical protein
MAGNITHIMGFRTADELRQAAALWQADGYTTVQAGPTARVHIEADTASNWATVAGKKWFVLIATKDDITAPEAPPAAADA